MTRTLSVRTRIMTIWRMDPSGLCCVSLYLLVELDLWTRGSAIRRAGYAGFKRHVAVAMGNWLASVEEPPEGAVAALSDAVVDEEPLVREHAAWALERSEAPSA